MYLYLPFHLSNPKIITLAKFEVTSTYHAFTKEAFVEVFCSRQRSNW